MNRSQKNLEDTLKNSSKIQKSDSLGETVEKKVEMKQVKLDEVELSFENEKVLKVEIEQTAKEEIIKEEIMQNTQFDDIKVKIKVFGVGGAGGNAINDMIKSGLS